MRLEDQLQDDNEYQELEKLYESEQDGREERGLRSEAEPQSDQEQPGDGERPAASGDESGLGSEQADDGPESGGHEEREQVLEQLRREKEQLQKALNDARAKERISSREAEELRELRERVDQLAARNAPAQDDDAKPDREKDPLAYLDWLDRKATEFDQTLRQQEEAQRQAEQHRQQMEQVQRFAIEAENDFKRQAQDYDDAFKFFAQSRVNQLQAFGYDEASAVEQFRSELEGVVRQHMQQGMNPAESIYKAAKASGYTPGKQPAQGGKAKPTPTLPTGGRPTKQNGISLEALENAPPEEFDKLWKEAERAGLFNQ